jgi:type II secretory pathway pseudopilin PulG
MNSARVLIAFGRRNAGLSLLETMIGLAVLTLLIAGALPMLRETPPTLILENKAAELLHQANLLRHEAAKEQQMTRMDVAKISCTPRMTQIQFFPEGTAQGPDLCIRHEGLTQILRLNRLTGRLE